MSSIKICSGNIPLKLKLLSYREVFVVYDLNVRDFALNIASGKPSFGLEISEKTKTMDTVMQVCGFLSDNGADRSALLLAVGGGITSDIAGFAAGIYKRGIRYAVIPTTLLSMVDASIGGKTGVNMDDYKNLLGTFHKSEFTCIFPKVLSSLPQRHLRSGVAEMLKTFIIDNSKGGYEKTLEVFLSPLDMDKLAPLIEQAARIKEKITRKDFLESGPRRVLNLGHTYGHAVEWWQGRMGILDPYTHGEAVAIGIVHAALLSEKEGIAPQGLSERLAADFSSVGLPVKLPCNPLELDPAIRQDKKAEGGKVNFVYIKRIGKVKLGKI